MLQTRQAVRRNFPLIGHGRYLLEQIRPEINQYFVESEHRRHARSAATTARSSISAPRASSTRCRSAPSATSTPSATSGSTTRWRRCTRPAQRRACRSAARTARSRTRRRMLNVSAMSYGSLSKNAILALNARRQDRRLRPQHRRRRPQPVPPRAGRRPHLADRHRLLQLPRRRRQLQRRRVRRDAPCCRNVKMIEVKLSQGAKPGHGGILPAAQADAGDRRDPRRRAWARTCVSPPAHTAFTTPIGLLQFLQRLRDALRRQAGRLQALRRQAPRVPRHLQGDARDGHRARLHHRRRRRGRHRRGAARVLGLGRHAAQRRAGRSSTTRWSASGCATRSGSSRRARSTPASRSPPRWRSAPTCATRRAR